MADRGELIEPAGAVGTKPFRAEPGAAGGVVDIDVGPDHQHQRAGSAAGCFLRGLGDHLAQGGLAGRIVGLFAAGEVEEQAHELGGRRIAAGDLRRCRRGEQQQRGQRRTGEADRSHARIPSVAPGSMRLEQVVAAEQGIGLMSWASVASALARAEREPGSSANREARLSDPSCRPWVHPSRL